MQPVDDKREISLAETMAPQGAVRDPEALATARTVMCEAAAPAGRDISLVQTQAAALEAARAAARSIDPGEAISLARTLASTGEERALSREELGVIQTLVGESRDQAITDDPELARRVLEPAGDDRRLKDLIRARLFRSKAAPVKIGRYTILDRLGEGGMGVVYTAYDDKLDRKIAVKVMRAEAEEGSVGRARLVREAQAMARLTHPNIVTVYEAGEVDGQIFVAMEFVRGQSLDQWLKEARPWRAVVEVFVQAGRGLLAAHRAGLVHRDFKPHNVLLGDDGAVKVLDFGLARSIGEEAEAVGAAGALVPTPGAAVRLLDARLTRTGAIMGTPAYMAPEQHQGLPTDARSDQFAFAVALFEGLHGAHPFDCSSMAALLHDVLRGQVREPAGAAKVPAWVRRAVSRAMAVDPARRFPSMQELLAELSRDPAARRRRAGATAAIAGLVGAIGFGAASLSAPAAARCEGAAAELEGVWDAGRKEAVARALTATGVAYAGETWARLEPLLDAYAAGWAAMRTEACASHQAGTHSDRLYDLRTACLDQRRAGLGALVEALSAADAGTVEKAVIAASSLPPLASCADTEALSAAVPPPADPAVARRAREIEVELAKVRALTDAGRAAAALERAGALRAEAESLKYEPLIAEAALRAGAAAMEAGLAAEAEASLGAAVSRGIAGKADAVALEALSRRIFVRASLKGEPASAAADAAFGRDFLARVGADGQAAWLYFNNVGAMHDRLGEVAAAEAAFSQALAGLEGPESVWMKGATLSNLGSLRITVAQDPGAAVGPFAEAEGLLAGSLGRQHPYAVTVALNLGSVHVNRGAYAEAEQILEEALARAEGLGLGGAALAPWIAQRGLLELETRDFAAARATFVRVLELARDGDVGREDMPSDALALSNLGLALGGLGAWEEAIAAHERTLRALAGSDALAESSALGDYGETLCWKGEYAGCLDKFQRSLDLREAKLPAGTPAIALALDGVGRALTGLGRYAEAEAALERARAISEAGLAAESPQIARVRRSLGELARARGDAAAAAEHFERAAAVFAMVRDPADGEMAAVRFAAAAARADRPGASAAERAAARAEAEAARAVLEGKGEGWARERAPARAWLAAAG